jgi:hypothetical protein
MVRLTCRAAGLWHTLRAYLAGRTAIRFEQERRTTLRTLTPDLPPGTEIYDSRPDGTILSIRAPRRIDPWR